MKKLSVIIPAFNEEFRIATTLNDIHNQLSNQKFDYEILVVNDGSTDGTAKVVEKMAKKIPKLSIINNIKNNGKGWVTKQGMLMATGDIRLFMDADNSTVVSEVFKMFSYLEDNYDIVVGSRCVPGSNIAVKQAPFRIFLGWVLRTAIHILIPLRVVDSQCGFKVFTEEAVNKIFPNQSIFGWAFDIEILSIAKERGLRVKEVPITWINNTESHITFLGVVKMFLEIIKIRIKLLNVMDFVKRIFKKIISIFPVRLIVVVYNFVNKVPIFERLTNNLIKSFIPEYIDTIDGRVFLNKEDVGVSGHLAMGFYEKTEADFFRNSIKDGMCVIDIGANIGYYTVLAGKAVGPKGKVFCYEPEDTNYSFLEKNIKYNNTQNITAEKMGLSNEIGKKTFFLTKYNKGTHSLANNRGVDDSIVVDVDTLDNSLKKYGSPKVDVIKMDIEGAEVLAIEGMIETIKNNSKMIIFTEFYPMAIKRLGRSPLGFLNKLQELGFALFLIDEDKNKLIKLEDFEKFINNFPNSEFVRNIYAVK